MIHKILENELINLNTEIQTGFMNHKDASDTRSSHHFENRFENIYISQEIIPELDPVLDKVLHHAAGITGKNKAYLQLGYWFNYMQPGDRTLAHSHDENDELLSCVYYIAVPENSGFLYIGEGENQIIIEPQESLLVFFSAEEIHSVGVNKSDKHRLSIGINIGMAGNE